MGLYEIILKLIGVRFKICVMKTRHKANEFPKTVFVKVPIDNPLNALALQHSLKKSWMWSWDLDSFKTIYTACSLNENKIIQVDGTGIYDNHDSIKKTFKNGIDRHP